MLRFSLIYTYLFLSCALTQTQHTYSCATHSAYLYTARSLGRSIHTHAQHTALIYTQQDATCYSSQHVIHTQHAAYTTRLLHTLTCAHHAAPTCDTLTCAHHAALTRITLRITPCLLASRCASRRAYSHHVAHHAVLTRITPRLLASRCASRRASRRTYLCATQCIAVTSTWRIALTHTPRIVFTHTQRIAFTYTPRIIFTYALSLEHYIKTL